MALLDALMLLGVGGLGSWVLSAVVKRKPKTPKYKCPWAICGYPLSDTPLVEKPETNTHYATYASEECEGCGRAIIYSEYTHAYVRYQPKGSK